MASQSPLRTDFSARFCALAGHQPFDWQRRLYDRLLVGDIPPECDIPTGLGKTSVLAVWLLALAEQATRAAGPLTVPRRLVYIVDRRVVVDQATTEAESLLKKLQAATTEALLTPVAASLRGLAAVDNVDWPFALSTLRGQYADNRQWSRDPASPAIIIGTVDMIGSRLLFSGYGGLGRYGRSQHAALLGQDTLVVFDEAQLAPAFGSTLEAIASVVRPECDELGKPFAVMSLTATQRGSRKVGPPPEDGQGGPLRLDPDKLPDEPLVRRRVHALKALRLASWNGDLSGKPDDILAQRMAQEAIELAGARGAVVVFADTVVLLNKVYDLLVKSASEKQCLRFTGQIRGFERDQKFSDDVGRCDEVYRAFRSSRKERHSTPSPCPVFLLATSAGEVGINFDAEHAVCDLVSLERMAQRFGRVNRYGEEAARITVFLPHTVPAEAAHLGKTQDLLSQLEAFVDPEGHTTPDLLSASPAALGKILRHPDAVSAYTPTGNPPPLDRARLDDWSLTSLRQDEFPRPQVSYWLRGITPDDDQAVTRLVWRKDLGLATGPEDACDLAALRPPLPREILQLPTHRAAKWLLVRAKKYPSVRDVQEDALRGRHAAVLTPAGRWEPWEISDAEDRERLERLLRGATVVSPTALGGLSEGGEVAENTEREAVDVLEESAGKDDLSAKSYRRVVLRAAGDNGWESCRLGDYPSRVELAHAESYPAIIRATAERLQQLEPGQTYRHLARKHGPDAADTEGEVDGATTPDRVEYFVSTRTESNRADDSDEPSMLGRVVPLQEHLDRTETYARRIVERLNLPLPICEAVVCAARWHDLGKARAHWQRAVGNITPATPWAKSDKAYFDRRETQGYRHEFGPLMDVLHTKQDELQGQEDADLILHLVAAHHGHGRPGFEEAAYDVPRHLFSECKTAAEDVELRFERLQRRFGWWGLAYLEALVKCADALASETTATRSATP